MDAALLWPHQLFDDHPALTPGRRVYLYEDQLFFGDWQWPARFHRLKLACHRASLDAHAAALSRRGHAVVAIPHGVDAEARHLWDRLRQDRVTTLHLADPVDCLALRRLRRQAEAAGVALAVHPSPAFLCPEEEFREFFKDAEHLNQTSFYRHLRVTRQILMDGARPAGGKWTWDTANRKPFPRDAVPPPVPGLPPDDARRRALAWAKETYPDNPGQAEALPVPLTRPEALAWLEAFIRLRLPRFGDYEDALDPRHPVLFHSMLSIPLNLGLLSPGEILAAVLERGASAGVSLNNLEGFVRQVLGWREYVRAAYALMGTRQRNANFFQCHAPMPAAFYDAATGLPPVDRVIRKVLATGYAHHIERLMVLGNAMLLCDIHPVAVCTWFHELFLDAYDWVMVPNVHGMSQFADGGLMTTKPYVSSSNYLVKMGEREEGPWRDVWDGLYWRFVSRHREFFRRNPRLSVTPRQLDRLEPTRRTRIFAAAEDYLARLHG